MALIYWCTSIFQHFVQSPCTNSFILQQLKPLTLHLGVVFNYFPLLPCLCHKLSFIWLFAQKLDPSYHVWVPLFNLFEQYLIIICHTSKYNYYSKGMLFYSYGPLVCFTACLCLDSVLIDCHGNILFAPPKDEGKLIKSIFLFLFYFCSWKDSIYDISWFCFFFSS